MEDGYCANIQMDSGNLLSTNVATSTHREQSEFIEVSAQFVSSTLVERDLFAANLINGRKILKSREYI